MVQNFQLIDSKNNSLRLNLSFNLRDEGNMSDSFGKKLQKWREDARINQSELARRVGVSPNYISNLERDYSPTAKGGKPQPSVEVVDKIAKALGINVNEARLAAGYAPLVGTVEYQAEVQALGERLASGVMASGFDALEDEQLREDFLADMQTIAESMLKRKLEEQEKRKRKNEK